MTACHESSAARHAPVRGVHRDRPRAVVSARPRCAPELMAPSTTKAATSASITAAATGSQESRPAAARSEPCVLDRQGNRQRGQHGDRVDLILGHLRLRRLLLADRCLSGGEFRQRRSERQAQFSLQGDQGLDVLAAGSAFGCNAKAGSDFRHGHVVLQRTLARYAYEANTPKSWAATCRELVLTGRRHRALGAYPIRQIADATRGKVFSGYSAGADSRPQWGQRPCSLPLSR
jgi:hypothetical protein